MAAGIIVLLVIIFGVLILNSNNKTNQLTLACQNDADYNGMTHVREIGNVGFCNILVNQNSSVQYVWNGFSWVKKKIDLQIYTKQTN